MGLLQIKFFKLEKIKDLFYLIVAFLAIGFALLIVVSI